MGEYLEHDKLEEVQEERNLIGDFLRWLQEQGFVIAESKRHLEKRKDDHPETLELDGLHWDKLVRTPLQIEDFLAKYFDIDQRKLQEEKEEMLEELREN